MKWIHPGCQYEAVQCVLLSEKYEEIHTYGEINKTLRLRFKALMLHLLTQIQHVHGHVWSCIAQFSKHMLSGHKRPLLPVVINAVVAQLVRTLLFVPIWQCSNLMTQNIMLHNILLYKYSMLLDHFLSTILLICVGIGLCNLSHGF